MGLIIFASSLAGATIACAVYQTLITTNLAWLCLLALNILWFSLLLWGLIVHRE